MTSNLYQYGLDDHFVSESAPYTGLFIARVTEQHREQYKAVTESGELSALVSGKLAFYAEGNAGFPAVVAFVADMAGAASAGSRTLQCTSTGQCCSPPTWPVRMAGLAA